MLFLIVAAAAVPLLYVWLIGHWFARVLVFLALAVVMGFGGAMLMGMAGPPTANNGWFGLLVGAALAWPISGIPLYVRKARSTSMELALR